MHRNSIGLIGPGIARAGIQLDMSSVSSPQSVHLPQRLTFKIKKK
jgi:hypothetical protein